MKIKHFTDLHAWQTAHQLILLVYSITKTFPSGEQFGLVSQMNRAAVSITSNIAEGFGRMSFKEKFRFYLVARGSLYELENQCLIIHDLQYISCENYQAILERIQTTQRILNGLILQTQFYSSKNN